MPDFNVEITDARLRPTFIDSERIRLLVGSMKIFEIVLRNFHLRRKTAMKIFDVLLRKARGRVQARIEAFNILLRDFDGIDHVSRDNRVAKIRSREGGIGPCRIAVRIDRPRGLLRRVLRRRGRRWTCDVCGSRFAGVSIVDCSARWVVEISVAVNDNNFLGDAA